VTWDEMIQKMGEYISTRTEEELLQIDKELGIEEIETPFGMLRVKRHRLFIGDDNDL